MRTIHALLVVGAVASATVLVSGSAAAGIDACGNIDVSANANCELVASGGCTAKCTPVSFQAACSAKLYAQCDGQCNASASAECDFAGCKAACEGQCSANPGSFECQGSCEADCSANCSGQCTAAANKGECEASCKATCSGECSAHCEGTPPEASCSGKCEASCQGSCTAQANLDCQISCQTQGFASCTTEMQGGCTARCQEPEGALFCDGQYVDAGGRFQECLDALEALVDVQGYASASGECSGNECHAEAEAGVSCAATPSSSSRGASVFAALLAALGIVAARRRRA